MADFSKQWCEINDPEMPYDFDILEEAAKCKPNEEGEVVLAMPNYEDNTMTWKPYNEIVK